MRNLITTRGTKEWRAWDIFPVRKQGNKPKFTVVVDLYRNGYCWAPVIDVHRRGKNSSINGWGPTKSHTFTASARINRALARTGLRNLRFRNNK